MDEVAKNTCRKVRTTYAKHFDKDGVGELIEKLKGASAFGAQIVSLIEDRRDTTLFRQRREWEFQII